MSTSDNQTQQSTLADKHLTSLFPRDFIWGAATSAYQVEGAAQEDGRGPSIWDYFSALPGKTYRGDTGMVAADHYHLMEQDVELMAQLGLPAYRFTISWPRILPEGTGSVNVRGLDFYDRLVDALLAKGITPFALLYHWDLPLALHKQGGWQKRETAYALADYAEVVARRLGDRVKYWITQNEPWCAAYLGYGTGLHAPGLQDRQAAVDAGHYHLRPHGLAVQRLRGIVVKDAQIGINLNFSPIYPFDDRLETRRDLERYERFHNRWFLDPLYRHEYPHQLFEDMELNPPPILADDMEVIATPTDFLGVNNYSRNVIRGGAEPLPADAYKPVAPVPEACYTDNGWEIFPQGIGDLLLWLHNEYRIPSLYVTENGAAFREHWDGGDVVHDPKRVAFFRSYIQSVGKAYQAGVPVRGYFVWSLMDNYEWNEGYNKRFGIVYVDYATQRRIPKDSAYWYASFLKHFRQS